MACPKKKSGRSARGHRRSKWKATVPTMTKCQNCGEMRLTHTACGYCNHYGTKLISEKIEVK